MSETTEQVTEVLMPLMGEGINEATLVRWLKKPGDKILRAEPLLEVSTDKVDTEIPSPSDGFLLAISAEAGATVSINSNIAFIGATADTKAPARDAPAKTTATTKIVSAPKSSTTGPAPVRPAAVTAGKLTAPLTASTGPVRSSPLVRKMAKDHGIHLHYVPGTGLSGRITRDDLVAFLATPQAAGAAIGAPGQGAQISEPWTPAPLPTVVVNGKETLEGVVVRREKMSKMRRLIAEHMVDSVRTSPHVTTVFEIDMNRIVASREQNKTTFEKTEGFKLTFTPYLIHAAAQAIKQFPIVNTSVDGDEVLFKDEINIACAVALEGGLIVPVIRNAGKMSLTEIARKLNDLVIRARSKKLMPDEVKGGTFSITNPGGFGSLTSNPIINQPQVAMLGIGAITKRAVVIEDQIVIRPIMLVSLTFDHRVVDGEGGAMYLAAYKKILESYSESAI